MLISHSSGRIAGAVTDLVMEPRHPVGRQPAIYMPSAALGGNCQEAYGFGLPNVGAHMRAIVKQGFKILSPSTGFTFGVSGMPASSALVGAGTMESAVAGHGGSGTVVLLGTSMGTAQALIYALEHPGEVACMVLYSPAYDLAGYYDTDFGGNRSEIGSAWGVTWPTPLPAAAQIMARADELQGVPILMPYASDDGYSSNIGDFAAASGAIAVNVGAVGHGDGTLAAMPIADVVTFIQANT